jgi:hypothetical protein
VSEKRAPLFLERQSYRGRRLLDFLRILPVIGVFLWSVPLLWPSGPDSSVRTSEAIFYIFGVWFFMVLVCAAVSVYLRRSGIDMEHEDG